MTPPTRPIRWWPAVAVVVLAALILVWTWAFASWEGQDKVFTTFSVVFFGGLLLLMWLLALSRMPWKTRGVVLAALVGVGVLVALLVRIDGVTGDFVPVLSWRWSPEPGAVVAAEAGAGEARLEESPEYPQFLGPHRNAKVPDVTLARDWDAKAPRELWRRPVGAGWSAFAVARGLAVTQEQHGDEERVVAYDLETGEPVWSHADSELYSSTVAGDGPRATPTIAGDRVYTMGSTGLLNALDLATGRELWSHDVPEENGGRVPEWGDACSPLVVDGLVVVCAGGSAGRSLVAYDAETGEPVWHGGDDASGYASPLVAELGGVRQVVIFNKASVAGHDPETGELLWSHPWPRQQPNVAQPVPLSADTLLVSTGYGIGSQLLRIRPGDDDRLKPEMVWKSPRLKAKFTNVVHHDGHVYGLDDGVMVCLDPQTGERSWKRGRYGHGQVILAGDLLLVQTEKGEILLVDPNPEELTELGSFQALTGKSWNSPALAGPYLLVRNDREAAAFELPTAR